MSPRRLLLVHPGALGDLVQALPAIGAVRARYADAAIALLTGENLAPLADTLGLVDEVLAVDTRAAYQGGRAARARAFAWAARAARAWRPDAAATFKAAPVWGAVALASGAPRRVGLTRGAVARALLTRPIDPPPDQHHESRYADVARALGADPAHRAAPRWPDALPNAAHPALAAGGPWLVLAPGGARNLKEDVAVRRWAPDRWAALAARLVAERPGLRVVLLGAPADRAEADVVRAALPAGAVVDLVGHTSIPEARAVIARAAACVVHDSGLLHVAATTSTRVVAIFGPSDPRVMCPRRDGVIPVWSPARALPCQDRLTGAVGACTTPCCIDRVSVETVFAAVQAALAACGPVSV